MFYSLSSIIAKVIRQIKDIFNTLSFQVKVILSIVLAISIFITLCVFFIVKNLQSNIDHQVIKLNQDLNLVQTISQLSSQVLEKDYPSFLLREVALNQIINSHMKNNSNISFIAFTDNSGRILAKSQFLHLYKIGKKNNKIPPPKSVPYIKVFYSDCGKVLSIAQPIQYNSNFFGWVWVGFPDAGFTIVGSNSELLAFLLEIFILVWLLSIIGAIVNSIIITGPLVKLEKGAKAISEGRFGFQLPLRGFLGKELSQLVKAFNKMSKRLKQYEESNIASLSSERNKFESIVMSITDGVIVLDKNSNIQVINHAACNFLNKPEAELLGKDIVNIFDVSTSEITKKYFIDLKNDLKMSKLMEQSTFDFIGNSRRLKVSITPLSTDSDENFGALIVMHDRTKEAEIELMKQEFISNVSHELRTPITSIKCYVDTLCSHDEQINEKIKKEFLSTINEETDRLSHLVNDVLELSKLESPSLKIQLSIQEVYPSLEYVIKSMMVLAHKKNIKFFTDIENDLPMLNINQENLERIIINFVSNAIKYTPENGMVKLVVKRVNDEVVFQVIDNGIGISEEQLPYIFERFYRVENKVHTVKGTGLGLTIVKKSVEQHNGRLNVGSKLGKGSVFEFYLPIPSILQDYSSPTKNVYNNN